MLSKYKFKDELGHPLENCIEYQQMRADIEYLTKTINEIYKKEFKIKLNKINPKNSEVLEIAKRYNIEV